MKLFFLSPPFPIIFLFSLVAYLTHIRDVVEKHYAACLAFLSPPAQKLLHFSLPLLLDDEQKKEET